MTFRSHDVIHLTVGFEAICTEINMITVTTKGTIWENSKKYTTLEDNLIQDLMKLKGCVTYEGILGYGHR